MEDNFPSKSYGNQNSASHKVGHYEAGEIVSKSSKKRVNTLLNTYNGGTFGF